ncbi:MAG: alpha-amylase domain-containing protein [Parafilimonas sp.]
MKKNYFFKPVSLSISKLIRSISLVLFSLLIIIPAFPQTTRVKKIVMEGFWWDYWNNNFPNAWSNYLTELAPRLKSLGIDAVWVPATQKNANVSDDGYAPFDAYDLGDKYQKGGSGGLSVRTRMGTKDELLRMIAVMHANGVEVIEDVVLNHVDGAGNNSGIGGQDPEQPYSMQNSDGYKNFRYVSYSTPLINDSKNDYWTRNGRWSKNYENFYPNQYNNCTTGDICYPYFGPDISYESTAYGQSSNIPATGTANINGTIRPFYNPAQYSDYMRTNGRNWITWYKKQTAVDGWRWDAVKHFPLYIQEDYIYNTKYVIPQFAAGGEAMFCVGEWVGTKSEIDNYVLGVRSDNELTTGAFDLSLRGYGANGGLYSMVMGQGFYDIQKLPADQQDQRYYDYATQRVHRTCPFINSHDTFRPILDASGNYSKPLGDYTGWNTNNELGGNGQHIDPREPRLYAAYATVFAMDGNPVVFFEDLFDIGTTGKRYTHLPGNATDLPIRADMQNIIQAHQKLEFKNGDYAVPTSLTGANAPSYQKGSSADHLVIERTGKALIGITDAYFSVNNNSQDQEVWVTTSFRNIDLIDYSGAHGLTTTHVQSDGRVLIKTAPCGHTISGARGHGYSIWAPIPQGVTFSAVSDLYNYLNGYYPSRSTVTTQEWEMANDLGDSNPNSLKQGGQLPDSSTALRTVGKIYAAANKTVTYKLYPAVNGKSQTMLLYINGTVVSKKAGTSTALVPLTGNYTPTADGWITIKVRNSNKNTLGQIVWANISYTAPVLVNAHSASPQDRASALESEKSLKQNSVSTVHAEVYPNPNNGIITIHIPGLNNSEIVRMSLKSLDGRIIAVTKGTIINCQNALNNELSKLRSGLYFLYINGENINDEVKLIVNK